MNRNKTIVKIALALTIGIICINSARIPAFASDGFQVSPMNQKIALIPGERSYGTFKITNPAANKANFNFELSVKPFTVNDSYDIVFENNGDYNQIVDWITLEYNGGVISPNNTAIINFYIDTPLDAPAGGQYASIVVASTPDNNADKGVNIQNYYSIAHVIYADVAGETVRGGDFDSISVPSFLFSGNISGTVSIKNTGNVHSDASYTLQVFPLFSKEEIYTNEEEPKTNTILPGSTRTTSLSWDNTPKVGIFHVIYTASFEGVESSVDKYVIVCPIWLLFIILACLFVVIFSIFFGGKKKR